MQIKCTAFLLLCLTVQAVAQSTFTPTSPAWSIAVQGGYRVRCGSDNIVRASANTAPSVTLNTYSTARVEQGSAAYTFTGKWAKNTTFMPDLILDSGNNAYIATNGPNQPGVSEVVALKFSSSATNPMLESSATITAPTNHTYTEVAERICSNGDLIILIQDSTSGANYQGIVADVNMAQPNATVTYQYTGSTASVASLTTVPYNSSYPSDTDFYACGYTTSGNTNTNRVWKFHSGGAAPDYSITVGAPGPFQDDYSVSNSYWNYINVDTDDDVLFVTGYVQIKIGQNSTGYYGENAYGCWTESLNAANGAELSPPAGLGDPNNPVAGVIIDECPQEMPAYAGKNYNQGQRAGLDQTNQIMYVCDQVSEPWGPVNGIRLGHYPYSLTYLNGTHQYTFSWGTDSLVGPGTPAVYPPDLGVTQPFGGEMVVDSTRCRFCSGLDTNNHAYLDQYVTGTGATLADESSAQTGTYVESLCTNESIGSAGEAYYLLEGYLYRFNI